jgi:nucleotide-binding universal stress UspA family protein
MTAASSSRRIVVGVDDSEGSAAALRWARHEADLDGAALTAVMAWSWLDQHHLLDPSKWDPEYGAAEAHAALGRYVEMVLGADALERVETKAVANLPATALLEAAQDADLLVVGARGLGGFRGLMLGSVSQQCLHRASVPVAIVRDSDTGEPARVVVAVDGSSTALAAARWAADDARRRRARLDVVTVWQLPYLGYAPATQALFDEDALESDAQAVLRGAVDAIDGTGLEVNPIALRRPTVAGIIESARGAEVLVMGSRGLGAVQRTVFGSIATQVSHHAPCPLVVLPPSP